ncbi:MAG: hypothetical protein D5R98_07975 [Desulfonatronovibrio sp. MSAO_Bac4]|nr:MAG: hypothetical protein D5R98_07975 [Desulfonatronovibrio sp. MSAO_Bac4]
MCRRLIRDLKDDPEIDTHLILDPTFMGSLEMLGHLNRLLRRPNPKERPPTSEAGYKELIKNHLFDRVVQKGRNIVLIIDEGQKISPSCLEVLRELLNYETNDHKLLQIVIFAQNEFIKVLKSHPNFNDRVSCFCRIRPLTVDETEKLINFRIEKASNYKSSPRPRIRFTRGAVKTLHTLTRGHPRRIMNLCHLVMLLIIVLNRYRVTSSMVKRAVQNLPGAPRPSFFRRRAKYVISALTLIIMVTIGYFYSSEIRTGVASLLLPGVESSGTDGPYYVRMRLDPVSEVEAGRVVIIEDTLVEEQERERNPHEGLIDSESEVSHVGSDNASDSDTENPAADSSDLEAPALDSDEYYSDSDYDFTSQNHADADVEGVLDAVANTATLESDVLNDHVRKIIIPDELGKIRVRRNENLWNIQQRVYGNATISRTEKIAAYNPHIDDLNTLYEGLRVFMPVTNTRERNADERFWIVTGTFADLHDAYMELIQTDSRRLRLVSYLDSESELFFSVAWPRSFATREDALNELESMPSHLAGSSDLLEIEEGVILN